MNWMRWTNLVVALLAGVAANVAGWLHAELDPQTEWGPWAYVAGAWATSALALAAWLPTRWRPWILVAGAWASAAWLVLMVPFAFLLNIAGHSLAMAFFAVAAWDERRATSPAPAAP